MTTKEEQQRNRDAELIVLETYISQLERMQSLVFELRTATNLAPASPSPEEVVRKQDSTQAMLGLMQAKKPDTNLQQNKAIDFNLIKDLNCLIDDLGGLSAAATDVLKDFDRLKWRTADDIRAVNLVLEASIRQAERSYDTLKKSNDRFESAPDARQARLLVRYNDDGTSEDYEMSLEESFAAIAGLEYRAGRLDQAKRGLKLAMLTVAAFGFGLCVGALFTTVTHGKGLPSLPFCMLGALKGIGALFGAGSAMSTLAVLHFKIFGKDHQYAIKAQQPIAAAIPLQGVIFTGIALNSQTARDCYEPKEQQNFMTFKQRARKNSMHQLNQLKLFIAEAVADNKIQANSEAHLGLLHLVKLMIKKIENDNTKNFKQSQYSKALTTGWGITHVLNKLEKGANITSLKTMLDREVELDKSDKKNPSLGQLVNLSRNWGKDFLRESFGNAVVCFFGKSYKPQTKTIQKLNKFMQDKKPNSDKQPPSLQYRSMRRRLA